MEPSAKATLALAAAIAVSSHTRWEVLEITASRDGTEFRILTPRAPPSPVTLQPTMRRTLKAAPRCP